MVENLIAVGIACFVLGYVTARIRWRIYAARDESVPESTHEECANSVPEGMRLHGEGRVVPSPTIISLDEREKLRLMQATGWLKQFDTNELRNEREAELAVARLRRFAQMKTICGCPFPHQDRLPYWHVFKRGEVWGAVATTGNGLEAHQVTWWGTWEEAIRFTGRNKLVAS